MRQWVAWIAIAILSSQLVAAQSETALWEYFEGRTVVAKTDLPATKAGVDIYPDASPAVNDAQFGKQLKLGAGTRRNEAVTITDVKVKPKSIEIELGGSDGGSKEDSSQVYVAAVKSPREKNLERDLERETDPARRERMEKELEDLRAQRAREDERLKAALAQLPRAGQDSNRNRAATSGSRFNLVFPAGVPSRALNPEYVMAALKPWIDFDRDANSAVPEEPTPVRHDQSGSANAPASVPERIEAGTEIRKGLTEPDLKRLLGDPVKREPYIEGDLHVEILTFKRDQTMLEATMVEGVLVRFREWSY